jgi:hypothetical protein
VAVAVIYVVAVGVWLNFVDGPERGDICLAAVTCGAGHITSSRRCCAESSGVKTCTVEPLIAHTRRWTGQGMGYGF